MSSELQIGIVYALTAGAWTLGTAAVVLAYPLWFLFTGPGHIVGPVQVVAQAYRSTLADLQQALPEEEFFRCHRGYIVNLGRVAEIVPFFNGTYTLRLKGGREEVPVSRANARRLREHFGLA